MLGSIRGDPGTANDTCENYSWGVLATVAAR